MMTNESEADRNKKGKPDKSPPARKSSSAAPAFVKPASTKHQSTSDELKAWADSKGLRPPK